MKTYTFQVVIEEDEWLDDRIKDPVWRAYIPELVHQGASSWGYTEKEALKNLQDAVDLLFEYLSEQGEEINLDSLLRHQKEGSSESRPQIQVSNVPLITQNLRKIALKHGSLTIKTLTPRGSVRLETAPTRGMRKS